MLFQLSFGSVGSVSSSSYNGEVGYVISSGFTIKIFERKIIREAKTKLESMFNKEVFMADFLIRSWRNMKQEVISPGNKGEMFDSFISHVICSYSSHRDTLDVELLEDPEAMDGIIIELSNILFAMFDSEYGKFLDAIGRNLQ